MFFCSSAYQNVLLSEMIYQTIFDELLNNKYIIFVK